MEKLQTAAKKVLEIVGIPTLIFAAVCIVVLLVTSFVPPESFISLICRKGK